MCVLITLFPEGPFARKRRVQCAIFAGKVCRQKASTEDILSLVQRRFVPCSRLLQAAFYALVDLHGSGKGVGERNKSFFLTVQCDKFRNSVVSGAELRDSIGGFHSPISQPYPLPFYRLVFPAKFSAESLRRYAITNILSSYPPRIPSIHHAPALSRTATALMVSHPQISSPTPPQPPKPAAAITFPRA